MKASRIRDANIDRMVLMVLKFRSSVYKKPPTYVIRQAANASSKDLDNRKDLGATHAPVTLPIILGTYGIQRLSKTSSLLVRP